MSTHTCPHTSHRGIRQAQGRVLGPTALKAASTCGRLTEALLHTSSGPDGGTGRIGSSLTVARSQEQMPPWTWAQGRSAQHRGY